MTIKYIFDKSINDKTMVNTYQSYDLDKSLTDSIVLNIFFDLTSDSANYFLHGVSDDVIRGNLTVTQRKHILSLDNVQAVIDYVLSLSPVSNVPNTGAGETPNDTPKQNPPSNGVPVSEPFLVECAYCGMQLGISENPNNRALCDDCENADTPYISMIKAMRGCKC